jgi:hypothetical protein
VGTLGVCTTLLLSGCGGGARQDASEPTRSYKLQLSDVAFTREQSVSKPASLRIRVHNSGTRAVPNLAVTLDSFYYTEKYPELAADKRPIWVVEQGPGSAPSTPVQSEAVSPPGGGQTAYFNTWALGPLAPDATRTFEWRVVPVKSGTHDVRYAITAGFAGKAKAVAATGDRALDGVLQAKIASGPPSRHVDPSTGRVVSGAFPTQP